MRKLLSTLFVITITHIAFGQTQSYKITGTVLDNDKEPLIAATVLALNPQDSIMASYSMTDAYGKFVMEGLQAKEYILQITYLGYGTFENLITIASDDKTKDLGTIILTTGVNQLDEVIVKGEFIPLTINKDTVEYNADAFRVRPNANVEELLKQMPGIEISSDGSIKAQGEDVQQVTVDGKKFFGNDPKMATKNIPANAVKKVQVYDQKSDRATFSGVDDGVTTKTINLELKEGRKVGLFGNVEAGYGTDNRYLAKASVNKFDGTYQLAGLLLFNNINQDGFSSEEMSLFNGTNSGFRFRGGNNGPSFTNGATTNLAGGLNFSYIPNNKWLMTGSYYNTYKDVFETENKDVENTLGNRLILENSLSNTNSELLSHKFDVDIRGNIDSTQRLDVDLNLNLNDNTGNYNYDLALADGNNITTTSTDQTLFGNEQRNNLSASTEYNKKFRTKQILTLQGSVGNVVNIDSSYLDQTTNNIRTQSTLLTLQDQLSRTENNNYKASVNLKQPLGKRNFLDFNAERSNVSTERLKDFLDYDPDIRDIRVYNDSLSTLVNNDVVYTRAGLDYTIDKETYTLSFGGKYNNSVVAGDIMGQESVNQSYNYFLPSLSLNLEETGLRINYRTSVSEPTATQLQSVVDNSNPVSVYVGNPDLQPEYNHNVSLRYRFFNRFNLNGLFAFANYTYTTNPIVTSQNITANLTRVNSPVNVDQSQRFNFSFFYNTPIRPLKLRSTYRVGTGFNKNINLINSVANDVTTFTPSGSIRFENTNNQVVSISVGANWAYNQNNYSLNTERNNSFVNHSYDSRVLLYLPKSWYIDFDYNWQIFDAAELGGANTIHLLHSSLSKQILDNKLELKLRAFDLLNQNKGLTQTIGDTYLERSVKNTINRYFLFTVIYNLNNYKG